MKFNIALYLSIFFLALVVTTANAQEIVTTTDGRTIILHSDMTYEFDMKAKKVDGDDIPLTELIDFKVDPNSFKGKAFQVKGNLLVMGPTSFLRRGEMDGAPIFVAIDDLSKDDKKSVFSKCDTLGCDVVLTGEYKNVMGQGGIRATDITLK